MITISRLARALGAAREVDPDVSTAAVRAAVEAALAEELREPRRPPDPDRAAGAGSGYFTVG
jgi:hypothetical protein